MDEEPSDEELEAIEDEAHVDTCPVCEKVTIDDTGNAEGIVLTTIEAIFNQDGPLLETLYSTYTPYDCHAAASMLANVLIDISMLSGADPRAWVERYRTAVSRQRYGAPEE